jgi:hypothetical protein
MNHRRSENREAITGSTSKNAVTTVRLKTPQSGKFEENKDFVEQALQSPHLNDRERSKLLHVKNRRLSISRLYVHCEERLKANLKRYFEGDCEVVSSPQIYGIRPGLAPFLPYVEKNMEGTTTEHDLTYRSFDPVNVVRNWLQSCGELHHGCCGPQRQAEISGKSGPRLLIDVFDRSLVRAPPTAKYVALSYVWGGSNASACTTNENFASLQKVNGINHIGGLPPTVADAMDFVRKLDIRYLWCDRLCIIQDGGYEKEAELESMGSIYALSYFTLVAAQGDNASHPLYVERRSVDQSTNDNPSKHTHASFPRSNKHLLLDQAIDLMQSKWYSRAWTFQEYLFSKRRVVFQSKTVNWECRDAAWHESQDIPPTYTSKRSASLVTESHLNGFSVSIWPDMARYARLVSIFNRRQLVSNSKSQTAFIRHSTSFLG